ncbi:MAG: asparagine synthase-related protein, partial [Micrococcales bacterium]|nr:asparagine synthase-related protein [Micrococcales bacterium]
MCGVAAIVGQTPPGADFDAAASAIAGRGPDGAARWDGDGLILVASRLAHWDEGAPLQPWSGPHGEAAAFNGELFNLSELQETLGLSGASEIEVLVAGLRELGPEFLRQIDGQFAAVVRLTAAGPTFAIRDRFGIAPLYWAELPQGVALASNLGAVLALRGDTGSDSMFDLDGLAAILSDWAPTGGLSPYRGIGQVRPGHVMVFDASGRIVSEDRWSASMAPGASGTPKAPPTPRPPEVAEVTPVSNETDPPAQRCAAQDESGLGGPESDLDELEGALRHAVGIRLRSTGRVACLLSGGIDSTIIGALAREQGARLGLALCLEGDEVVSGRQRQVAEALDMDFVQHMLTPRETVDTFVDYVRTRRVPLVRLGPIGMTALARRARAEGIRGVLSGEGADELFAGYDSYRILAARAGHFGPVRELPWTDFGVPEFGADRGRTWARSYWRGLIAFSSEAGARRLDILRPVADLFRSPLREIITGDSDPARASGPQVPPPTREEAYRSSSTRFERSKVDRDGFADSCPTDLLNARREVDLVHLLAGYLLTVQGDHAWMEEGVELRPPYLAAPVADWALRHCPTQFVSVPTGKLPVRALLRRLAARRPTLAELDFAKAAFRVDVNFLLRDPVAFERFAGLVARCPDDLLDGAGLSSRVEDIRSRGTCSEAESMLLTLAASNFLVAALPGERFLERLCPSSIRIPATYCPAPLQVG